MRISHSEVHIEVNRRIHTANLEGFKTFLVCDQEAQVFFGQLEEMLQLGKDLFALRVGWMKILHPTISIRIQAIVEGDVLLFFDVLFDRR
jgi:hypothetical protein